MPRFSKWRLLSAYDTCKNSFSKWIWKCCICTLLSASSFQSRPSFKCSRRWEERLYLYWDFPCPATTPIFFKTSLKTFLDLIYFPSQFQIGTGNKQYALCLLLSNLVCIVINLHNVSQTGLFSLMTPGTPFGIFVGKTSGVFQDRFPIV